MLLLMIWLKSRIPFPGILINFINYNFSAKFSGKFSYWTLVLNRFCCRIDRRIVQISRLENDDKFGKNTLILRIQIIDAMMRLCLRWFP